MNASAKRTLRLGITAGLSLGAIVGVVGCAEQLDELEADTAAAVTSINGLSMNGLSMNGLSMNGLSMNGLSMNGLSMNGLSMNGLSGLNGLSGTNGLMTTDGGRAIVKYMVMCAYPQGHNLVKNGITFEGKIGIAPEAEFGTCDLHCQEKISACMLAHVNNSGLHVGIWMVGPDNGIGWGASPDFPYMEATYFGNLIANPWEGNYCAGKNLSAGDALGRMGQPIGPGGTMFQSPFGTGAGGLPVQCNTNCTASNEGYSSCQDLSPSYPYTAGHAWTHPITVYRNFEGTQMYKVCNKTSGKCLGVVGGSTAENQNIEQRTYSNAAGQNWQILQVSPGNYKLVNVTSGKVLSINGSQMAQKTFVAGLTSQILPIAFMTAEPGKANIKLASNTGNVFMPAGGSTNDGALVQSVSGGSYGSADVAKWTFTAVGLAPTPPPPPPGGGGGGGGSNPCASFCTSAVVFNGSNYSSGNVGTTAICRETTTNLGGGGKYNVSGRTFSINGVAQSGDGPFTLPAKVNGGYCFQLSAGGLNYASFNSW